jgi:hypothetical protein
MEIAPMAEATRVEMARKTFANVTGALENVTIVAAEGQVSRNRSAVRQSCDCIIGLLKTSLEQLQRSRRRLG